MTSDTAGWPLQCYALALILFHSSEFFLAVFYHRRAGAKSLLLSRPYIVALAAGVAEHILERWLVPEFKNKKFIASVGLALVVAGEFIRKLAIVTAQRNFTHDIRVYREEDHQLVTHGIYRYVRHPSYLGFLLFAVGTQVLLCNPLTTIGFIVVLWRFFADRIEYEEYLLVEFFGEEYEKYADRVPSGMPFVK